MRLLRVQVPEFRALKDVDISFEPEFTPQVFPLGSLNGGGKSTLLQLMFVLLHSFRLPFREHSLKTLLESDSRVKPKKNTLFASLSLLTLHGRVQLEYYYGDKKDVQEHLQLQNCNNPYIDFETEHLYAILMFLDFQEITEEIQKETLDEIQNNIFLIAPSNQGYLFLSNHDRRLLYSPNKEKTYELALKNQKQHLPNFFTYDFIDVLTEVFRLARDKDYNERLKTGIYGSNSEQLENAINRLFIDGKKIIPLTIEQKRHTQDAIQSMGFQLPSGIEIYPEDLSHGELKRLTIFILLKYHDIQDSIILMDEIENGFHLDWQYNIVCDLVDWGKTNQYILATHSYELCTAVTPAHVKEINLQHK